MAARRVVRLAVHAARREALHARHGGRAARGGGGSKKSGPAHRFVGLARQRSTAAGSSTRTGTTTALDARAARAPAGQCGIVVGGETAPIEPGGDAVVLDNTFVHHVYNNDPRDDRFVLMCEVWHPSLSSAERDALATLFAVKDRFTVLELELAPWGYDDDDLGAALQSGAVRDLDFWKEIGAAPSARPARRAPRGGPPRARRRRSAPRRRASRRSGEGPARVRIA